MRKQFDVMARTLESGELEYLVVESTTNVIVAEGHDFPGAECEAWRRQLLADRRAD